MTVDRFRRALLVAMALLVSAPTAAIGGEQVDPNLGDDVLGRSGGVRYSSETTAMNVDGNGTVDVGCGAPRWHALSGGSASGGPVAQAWQSHGRPLDFSDGDEIEDDGWYTGGDGVVGAPFTGYSICVDEGAIRYRRAEIEDQPSSDRAGVVTCGGARWHVAGGSAFIATSDSWVNATYPWDGPDGDVKPDDGWQGKVHDTIGGAGGFFVNAICTLGDLRYVRRAPVAVEAGTAATRRVACPEGEPAVGGGARVSGSADRARLVTTRPYDDGDQGSTPDDGWEVRAYNVSGADKKVTAYAICVQG